MHQREGTKIFEGACSNGPKDHYRPKEAVIVMTGAIFWISAPWNLMTRTLPASKLV
ncbi:hypothetical protein BOTBODRAFT_36447, partial [Botryobasidium botryosum FD-172 SS1]